MYTTPATCSTSRSSLRLAGGVGRDFQRSEDKDSTGRRRLPQRVPTKIDCVLRSQCISRRATTFLRIDALIVASRQSRGVDVDLPSPDPEESKDGLYSIEADGGDNDARR